MRTLVGAVALFASIAGMCVSAAAPQVTSAAAADARQRCLALRDLKIPATSIGLPTNGATIVSATFVIAADAGNSNGEFCQVLGRIHPVDPIAPDIKFEVNLPTRWNNRLLQMGGGGFDGTLVTGLGGASNQVPAAPTPLALGYVTVGSDSGHETAGGFDGRFALNAESFANFGRLQIKKTHDVAIALVHKRYGASPRHSYFIGGSQGGHEALIAALFYTADYDGIVAHYPAYDLTLMHLAAQHRARALFRGPDTWISPDKMKTIAAAVYGACDGLDGVTDGIVSNVGGCNRVMTMDALRARLRCPDGRDSGATCLSDGQLATVETFNTPFSLGFPLSAGLSVFPKLAILDGATFLNALGQGPVPSTWPTGQDATQYAEASGTVRYVITRDVTADPLAFEPGKWATRITEVSEAWDANSVDLSQFMSKGGKLILTVGSIDHTITPYNTVNYYERLVARFGQAAADTFVRFYRIPGFAHGNGLFNAKFDALGALDAWVDGGRAPGTLEAVDVNPQNHQRRRPLCVYPSWPRYTGSGDVNAASSFRCVTGDDASQTN
ncbi:MAG TPA: tannase/feruloyl esterase family alpha/beta hydrolase [Vicinamibacterales bacterium]|nr:tannase/feruloyl esterase family alpha/beta hydrolase [Vicinamibacterales bacterium]